jgi:peptidoglycan biosynthesis protein MviN/MurJ (putative lipid II flippase)
MYFIVPPALKMLLTGEKLDHTDIHIISYVVEMGVLQVPFFACQLILIKYATAMRSNKPILISSSIGLVLNIVLNYFLMHWMGVASIALATSISIFFSTGIILLLIHNQGNINWLDMIYIGLSWMLFLTMMLCFHYDSYAGVAVASATLLLILFVSISENISLLVKPHS